MVEEIFLFTLNGCEHCELLKKTLENNLIMFREIDINIHSEIWNTMVNNTNNNTVPTILLTMNNGDKGIILIPGQDFNSEGEALSLLQKYI